MEMLLKAFSKVASVVKRKKGETSFVNKTKPLETYFICQAMYTKT